MKNTKFLLVILSTCLLSTYTQASKKDMHLPLKENSIIKNVAIHKEQSVYVQKVNKNSLLDQLIRQERVQRNNGLKSSMTQSSNINSVNVTPENPLTNSIGRFFANLK